MVLDHTHKSTVYPFHAFTNSRKWKPIPDTLHIKLILTKGDSSKSEVTREGNNFDFLLTTYSAHGRVLTQMRKIMRRDY